MDQELDTSTEVEYVADTGDSEITIDTGNPIETNARALGWKPFEEFTGDPEKWTEAEEYVARHEKHNGVLKKANEKLSKDVDDLRAQMERLDAMHKSVFDMQIKKATEEHQQQIAFLKAQKRQARQNGDLDTADELDEQIDSLREQGPELPEAPPPTKQVQDPNAWRKNPVLSDWADRNTWFEKDKAMTVYAVATSQELQRDNPNMSLEERLQVVSMEVRKEFPHKFQARRNPVEGGASAGGAVAASGARRSYNTLPAEAKRQCDMDVASGMDKGQWVQLYYSYEDRRKK